MPATVVVDTMIASAWLGVRPSQRKARWAAIPEPAIWVLPFTVVAEMRFGAEVGGVVLDRALGPVAGTPTLVVHSEDQDRSIH